MQRNMRKLFILFFLFLGAILSAQEIEVVSFEPTLDISAKLNPVYDINGQAGAMLRISLASDKVSFEGNILESSMRDYGDWIVYVPSGTRFIRISVEGYAVMNYIFPVNIESYHTYEMVVNLPVKEKAHALIMPTYSIGTSQSSYGLMIGFAKKIGGYIRAKSDFNFGITTVGVCDASGNTDEGSIWLTGQDTKKSRLAITGGALFRVAKPLYLYVGAGYGSRILAWQSSNNTDYYRVEPVSFTGFEAEAGILANFGIFAISAGVQTNQFKYVEANLGIGLMF